MPRIFPCALVLLAVATIAVPVGAQCGAGTSQCLACHETRRALPVLSDGAPWHREHAYGDFCAVCHGGDPEAKDEASAHVGLFGPLDRVDAACGTCHGANAQAFAQRYLAARAAQVASPARAASPPRRHVVWGNVVLAVVVVGVGLGGGAFVARNERRLRGGSS